MNERLMCLNFWKSQHNVKSKMFAVKVTIMMDKLYVMWKMYTNVFRYSSSIHLPKETNVIFLITKYKICIFNISKSTCKYLIYIPYIHIITYIHILQLDSPLQVMDYGLAQKHNYMTMPYVFTFLFSFTVNILYV